MPILDKSPFHPRVRVLAVRRRTLESLERRLRGDETPFDLSGLFLLSSLILIGFLITYVPPSAKLTDDPVLSHIGGVLIAGLTGLLVWSTGFRIRADSGVLSALALLFILAIGSSTAEPEQVRFMVPPLAFLFLGSMLFASYLGSSRCEPDMVCTSFWATFATISLVVAAAVQLVGGIHVLGISIEPQVIRWAGWFGNPNRFGPAVALGVLAAFSLAARARTRTGVAAMGLLGLVLIAGVVSSGSRATLLALVVSLIILLWLQTRHTSMKILAIAVAILAVLVALIVIPQEAFEVYARKNSNAERIGFVRQGLEMFLSGSPLEIILGHGYGEFQRVTGRSTHNGYIRWILEFGVLFTLGMMALFALLLARARLLGVRSRHFRAFVLAILGFLLIREIGAPALISMRMEGLAFAFVIGALAAQPRRAIKLEVYDGLRQPLGPSA
jgi:O-antigen ligase